MDCINASIAELQCLDIKTCKNFTIDVSTFARVLAVYDGDTITVVFKFAGEFQKFKVRLDGIDTAELHGELSALAIKARDRLAEFIANSNQIVWLDCKGLDKYGRLLANVWDANKTMCFSTQLLDEHLAYEYHGKTKPSTAEQAKMLTG
jgi:endonuclease YncB( thermonuclease family)